MQNVTGLLTVEWKNNKVIMIEQTKLPNELIFVEYDDFIHVLNYNYLFSKLTLYSPIYLSCINESSNSSGRIGY